MSVQTIIGALEKLIVLHEELLDLSNQKMDAVKESATEKLQKLLVKERKYVQEVEQAETKRQKTVEEWLAQQQTVSNQATITDILASLPEDDTKALLEDKTIRLTDIITKLKQQEQINQALLKQSMQFVELSLDIMRPTIRNMNYGKNQSGGSPERSVFDSKA